MFREVVVTVLGFYMYSMLYHLGRNALNSDTLNSDYLAGRKNEELNIDNPSMYVNYRNCLYVIFKEGDHNTLFIFLHRLFLG